MNTMFRKCCSIVVGLVYVASGLLKVMDPVGTGLIVEAYFRFMHIPESALVAKILGVVLGALETAVGFAAVFCVWPRITRWIMLGMQSAFTLLSLALVIWNPQMHCGCFGEAIHLTHWQTFIKNIVLMGMLWFAYFPLLEATMTKIWQYIAFASSVILMAGFAVYSWYYIPVIDFTDYKIGTEIVSQGEYWNLSEEERETRAALPMLGAYDKPDPDIIKGKWAIISLYDLPEDDLLFWTRFMVNFRILKKQGYEVVVLTSAPEDQMKEKIQMFAVLPFLCPDKVLEEMREALYLTSRTTAISLNRNNGGVTFLTDGVITRKRVAKDYPEISSVFRYN
ncbi:MAG: hypothetical protein J6B97_06075 [Bacteroidales bacterium]|nr:hypothetical protein [Bacteroidales bacterium]